MRCPDHSWLASVVFGLCLSLSTTAGASETPQPVPSPVVEVHLPVALEPGAQVRLDQLLDEHYELPLDEYLLYEVIVEADVERRSRRAYAEVTVGRTRLGRTPLRDHATVLEVPAILSTRWQLKLGPAGRAHGLRLRLLPLDAARTVLAGTHRRRIDADPRWNELAYDRYWIHQDRWLYGGAHGWRDRSRFRGRPDPFYWRHPYGVDRHRYYGLRGNRLPAPRRHRERDERRSPAEQETPIEHRQWRNDGQVPGAARAPRATRERSQRASEARRPPRASRNTRASSSRLRAPARSAPRASRGENTRSARR